MFSGGLSHDSMNPKRGCRLNAHFCHINISLQESKVNDRIMPISAWDVAIRMGESGLDDETRSVISLSDYGSDIDFDDVDEDSILGNMLNTTREQAKCRDINEVSLNEIPSQRAQYYEQDVDTSTHLSTSPMSPVVVRKRKSASFVNAQGGLQSLFVDHSEATEAERNKISHWSFSGMFDYRTIPLVQANTLIANNY